MAESFIGEIRMFGGNFAPLNWAFCNGSTLAISQNDALFSLIGTTYGGDGQSTFNLPDLRGRVPVHQGTGPGLSTYIMGEVAGTETVTLTTNQLPSHNHTYMADSDPANATTPQNQFLARSTVDIYTSDLSSPAPMNAGVLTITGGSQPHDNMMPFLAISFILSLYGVFPTQN